jgi:regulator of cell morphogenesis and NO signaling
MEISKENKIGELVAEDYRTAAVFQKHHIDYCCKGQRSIEEACQLKKLDAEKIVEDIRQVMSTRDTDSINFQSWPLDLLADYIEKKHHRYVEETTPALMRYLDKLCQVHGANHPELLEIRHIFGESAQDLAMHMKKEELVLFPYIRKLVSGQRSKREMDVPPFGTVQNPVQMMMQEHDTEGERFRMISELTGNYNPPADACNTYRVAYSLLQEFENDLHRHIHLENNLLFPGAIKLEKELDLVAVK